MKDSGQVAVSGAGAGAGVVLDVEYREDEGERSLKERVRE